MEFSFIYEIIQRRGYNNFADIWSQRTSQCSTQTRGLVTTRMYKILEGHVEIPRGSQLTYLRLKSHQTYQGQAFEEKALGLLLMAGAKNWIQSFMCISCPYLIKFTLIHIYISLSTPTLMVTENAISSLSIQWFENLCCNLAAANNHQLQSLQAS